MGTLGTILITIGVIALIEAYYFGCFPKDAKKLFSNPKKTRKIGIIELFIGILLIIIGIIL